MIYHELPQLRELLVKYQSERLDKYRDDGDNLISGIDTVHNVVCEDLIKVRECGGLI